MSSEEFDQARKLIQIGFARVLVGAGAGGGGAEGGAQPAGAASPGPAASPTEAGLQFPGGGFQSPGTSFR